LLGDVDMSGQRGAVGKRLDGGRRRVAAAALRRLADRLEGCPPSPELAR
jgi:hypothetical protein